MKTGLLGAAALTLLGALAPLSAQPRPGEGVANIRYDVTFDAETALEREIHVETSFDVASGGSVLLSLPAWTPGSYDLADFARNVRDVWAVQDGVDIRWDKADFDTWRVHPTEAGRVTFGFDYAADALDNGAAWSQPDFAFFNGTNVFFFPEGSDLDFDADVVVHTESDWGVATGLTPGAASREFRAGDYHELVDMPTFVGRFDLDSLEIDGAWYRLATYPAGLMTGQPRQVLWNQIQAMMGPMTDVFDDVPWETYTTLLVFDTGFGGGAALEHASSHLGIYSPAFLLSESLASITAHEIFHAWNVKRLRPAALWPYAYDRRMPTELLWISEGITDYYADLALVRGGISSRASFFATTQGKIDQVSATPPVALEDASLSAWVSPRDGTSSIYYPKGSLAGLMLDILIRDETDNEASLDDVMKALYEDAYLRGRGFTEADWWGAVRDASGGRSFEDFHDAYIDGREPYPWDEVLPLAGLRLRTLVERVPRIGIVTRGGDEGLQIVEVTPGAAASDAGVQVGDVIVSVADIEVEDNGFGAIFRARMADSPAGTPYEIVVERGEERIALSADLRFAELTSSQIEEDREAGEKAQRIREGLLRGITGSG